MSAGAIGTSVAMGSQVNFGSYGNSTPVAAGAPTANPNATMSQSSTTMMQQGGDSLKNMIGMLAMAMLMGDDKDKEKNGKAGALMMMALAAQSMQPGGFMYQNFTNEVSQGLAKLGASGGTMMPPVGNVAAAYASGASGGAAAGASGGAVNVVA